jgi:hypothetical protein
MILNFVLFVSFVVKLAFRFSVAASPRWVLFGQESFSSVPSFVAARVSPENPPVNILIVITCTRVIIRPA